MLTIVFDFSLLSYPYGLRRCTNQLIYLALAAEKIGCDVRAVTSQRHLAEHPCMNKIKRLWQFAYGNPDIYIAKADAFYRDRNWLKISGLDAFKVCLCNSDYCFRESNKRYLQHKGTPVQIRCDLYMPCNYTKSLLDEWGYKVVPAAHPIDVRMFALFEELGLVDAYITDDVDMIRSSFDVVETRMAGFMGASRPHDTRWNVRDEFPAWVDLNWTRTDSSINYINWILERRGVIDLRGNGDKSMRFSEAALFGRTIITKRLLSEYNPKLVNNHNCIVVDEWSEIDDRFDLQVWRKLANQATLDYKCGWSMKSMIETVLEKSRA